MYVVVTPFSDLTDNMREYKVGDKFPRKALKVSQARYKELSTVNNKQKKIFIVKVEEEKK